MTEAGDALGLDAGIEELLDGAARELAFGQLDRARELCERALEGLGPDADLRGVALYLRGLSREDPERVEDLRRAVAALDRHADPVLGVRARLALARTWLERDDLEAARASYAEALAQLAGGGHPVEHAQALLGIARLELAAGARRRAMDGARDALGHLAGALSLEARRHEVLALELLADAAEHAPEAIGFLEEAVARADRLELGHQRVLVEKLDALRARRGPFR